MRRGGYESSGRSVRDLAPPPAGPAPGMKRAGYGTDDELWQWAATIHDEGRSDRHRGRYSMDPTLHLIPRGTNELWCSGGPAERANTARRRLCRRCLNLARDMWHDLEDEE